MGQLRFQLPWSGANSARRSGKEAISRLQFFLLKVCMTESGATPNLPCVFPFRHWGKTYWTCTTDGDKKPWCSTKWVHFWSDYLYWHRVCIWDVYITECISDLLITTGWTDTETTNLETGETAILPPACRGTVATNQDFISSVYNKYDRQQIIHTCPLGWCNFFLDFDLNLLHAHSFGQN